MKFTTKQLVATAILLAVCIASQFYKNTSVYITGPIVNLCLLLATLFVGTLSGIILSIITPITAFFITGNPLIAAIPLIMPMIMIGNAILVLTLGLLKDKLRNRVILPMLLGSALKATFMAYTISYFLIPRFIPEKLKANMAVFQTTFSFTQFTTALMASIVAALIWMPINRALTGAGASPRQIKRMRLLDEIYGPEKKNSSDNKDENNNVENKDDSKEKKE